MLAFLSKIPDTIGPIWYAQQRLKHFVIMSWAVIKEHANVFVYLVRATKS